MSKSSCVYGWICGFHKDVNVCSEQAKMCVYGWICGLHNVKFLMSKQRHVGVCVWTRYVGGGGLQGLHKNCWDSLLKMHYEFVRKMHF